MTGEDKLYDIKVVMQGFLTYNLLFAKTSTNECQMILDYLKVYEDASR